MKVRFAADADEALTQATRYFARQPADLAAEFVEDVRAAVHLLHQFPECDAPVTNDVRRLLLERFKYQLIHRVEGAEIRIYAVAHLKRRPRYWRRRIP